MPRRGTSYATRGRSGFADVLQSTLRATIRPVSAMLAMWIAFDRYLGSSCAESLLTWDFVSWMLSVCRRFGVAVIL